MLQEAKFTSNWLVFLFCPVVCKGAFKAELKYLKCGTLLTMKYVLLTCLSL